MMQLHALHSLLQKLCDEKGVNVAQFMLVPESKGKVRRIMDSVFPKARLLLCSSSARSAI